MTEADYQRKIQSELEKRGAKVIKIHGNEYMERGTPDLIGCLRGIMFVIETKIYPNKVSAIQERRLNEWANVGAVTLIAVYPSTTAVDVATLIVSLCNEGGL